MDNQPINQVPRTALEFKEVLQKNLEKSTEEIKQKAEKFNESIKNAIKIMVMVEKAEGWPILWSRIQEHKAYIKSVTDIGVLTGGAQQMGEYIIFLQGQLTVIELIEEILDKYKHLSKEQPLDTNQLSN